MSTTVEDPVVALAAEVSRLKLAIDCHDDPPAKLEDSYCVAMHALAEATPTTLEGALAQLQLVASWGNDSTPAAWLERAIEGLEKIEA